MLISHSAGEAYPEATYNAGYSGNAGSQQDPSFKVDGLYSH
jgi:hypothetical protein